MIKIYKRVVITGMGVVSSIGIGKDLFWKNLIAGRSAVSIISSFDTSDLPTNYGAEVKDFRPEKFLETHQIESMGRASQMAIVASKLAIKDACLDTININSYKAGIIIGSTMGESQNLERIDEIWAKQSEENIEPKICEQYPVYNISNNLAREFNFQYDNLVIPCACAAGNYAIAYAYDQLKMGRTDLMLAGGVDTFSRIAFVGFNRLLSMAPEKCAPFDKNRHGIILGEGAGILILEPLDTALKRNAPIYAEIIGYGISCDAYHMTKPQFGGIITAILSALENANISIKDVDYICAHGTGTLSNDRTETLALKKIFGGYLKNIPVSSIKSMLGHTMGAATALEAIACALTITHDIIPPTINYETPDQACNIDCVPNVCRKQKVNIALNNGFAFGGNNACIILKKYQSK